MWHFFTITNGKFLLKLAPTDKKKKQFTQNIKMLYFVGAKTQCSFHLQQFHSALVFAPWSWRSSVTELKEIGFQVKC